MRTGKQAFFLRHIRESLLFLAALVVTLYVALAPEDTLLKWFSSDDGFFYFQVARHILSGVGISFDGISLTNGFHPLWLLLCLPIFSLGRGDLIVPLRVVVGVFGLLQFLTMLVIYRTLAKQTSRNLAFLLAAFLGLNWVTYNNLFTGGLESALAFFLVVCLWSAGLAFSTASPKKPSKLVWIGLLAGLTVLSRLDTIFLAVFLGVWLVLDSECDALEMLADALLALVIPITAAILRVGFGITPLEKQIIFFAAAAFLSSTASGFITGRFSLQPILLKIHTRRILGGLITAGLITGLTGLAYFAHLLPELSISLFLLVIAGWTVVAVARPYLTIESQSHVASLGGLLKTLLRWLPAALSYFVPFAVLVGGYMLWSQLVFGTPMPISGQVKHWWGSLHLNITGAAVDSAHSMLDYLFGPTSPFSFLAGIFFASMFESWKPVFITSIVLAFTAAAYLALALKKQKITKEFGIRLLIFPLLTAVVYRVLYFYISGYIHIRSWYWVTETFLSFIVIAGILIRYHHQYQSPRGRITGWVMAILLCVPSMIGFGSRLIEEYSYSRSTGHAHLAEVRALEEATPVESVIGMVGGGTVSYFIQGRTIVNLDGLMNSKAYFDGLRAGDTSAIMQDYGVQYIYAVPYIVTRGYPYKYLLPAHLVQTNYRYGDYALFQYLP